LQHAPERRFVFVYIIVAEEQINGALFGTKLFQGLSQFIKTHAATSSE
jgi:hypothetical protein